MLGQGLLLFTILLCITQVILEQVTFQDGWVPMSPNDVYNQIHRNPVRLLYINEEPPKSVQRKLNSQKRKVTANIEVTTEIYPDIIPEYRKFNSGDKAKGTLRRPKKVVEFVQDIDNAVSENDAKNNNNTETENNVENIVPKASASSTYEVTEETELSITENITSTEDNGYQYPPPKEETENLTMNFHKILSNYNIKQNDKLQNYDISLQRRIQNPWINRLPLPYRYNNLNHLPVDPLLAVFLSNYGFYLPSLYGIKNNYHNLYGYLASNNIHNNRPFGSYKIFSDTDSWS